MTMKTVRLLLTIIAIVTTTVSWAAPGDQYWVDDFYLKSLNRMAHAMVVDSHGNIFVGGEFDTADDHFVGHIAMWSNGSWSSLRSGVNDTVYALAIGPGGDLYVGGRFSDAGGDADADHIAVWNGSAWSSLGGTDSGLNDHVRDLAFDASGNLYAVGDFTDAGGDPEADRVAVWNGSGWSSMGGPGSALTENVYTVAVSNSGTVIIGGHFTDAGGSATADYIAGWNGSGWSAIGGGLNGTVYELVFRDNGDLYVGGNFSDAGGVPDADLIAVWSSPSWRSVGGAGSAIDGSSVTCILFDGDDNLFVGGNFTDAGGDANADRIARWTGTRWVSMGGDRSGLNSSPKALAATDTGDIIAVGGFTHAGNYTHTNYAARWDGGRWSALSQTALPTGGGLVDIVHALAFGPDGSLYAGGDFNDAGGDVNADYLAVWDGSTWDQVGDPIPAFDGSVYAIAVNASHHVAVGGEFTDAAGIEDAHYFAYWDGAAWTVPGGTADIFDAYVHTLTWAEDGRLFVGGEFWEAAGVSGANYVAIWDGAAWSAADGPGSGPDGSVFDLTLDDSGVLYAGGYFDQAGGDTDAVNIAMWNGSAWSSIGGPGSGLDSYVFAVAVDGLGRIYAGGDFDDAGGDPNADHIAMWNGSSWTALGEGLNDEVRDLVFDGEGNLYATGFFDPQAATPSMARRIAVWDGSSWNHVGSGLDNNSNALAYDGGSSVCVGGEFEVAGYTASNRIGCWAGATPAGALFADGFENGDVAAWSSSMP